MLLAKSGDVLYGTVQLRIESAGLSPQPSDAALISELTSRVSQAQSLAALSTHGQDAYSTASSEIMTFSDATDAATRDTATAASLAPSFREADQLTSVDVLDLFTDRQPLTSSDLATKCFSPSHAATSSNTFVFLLGDLDVPDSLRVSRSDDPDPPSVPEPAAGEAGTSSMLEGFRHRFPEGFEGTVIAILVSPLAQQFVYVAQGNVVELAPVGATVRISTRQALAQIEKAIHNGFKTCPLSGQSTCTAPDSPCLAFRLQVRPWFNSNTFRVCSIPSRFCLTLSSSHRRRFWAPMRSLS
eukprot:m.572909 g.572909  ORF g.572909 m.572909 type:complete len:299 (+) comp57871_c0_seq7:368-1264(+)